MTMQMLDNPPPTITVAMTQKKASILSFRFDDFMSNCCSSRGPRDVLAASAATDESGSNWRLLLRKDSLPPVNNSKKKKQEDDRVVISMVLVKERSRRKSCKNESTKFSFVIRDQFGKVAHEESFLFFQCKDVDPNSFEYMKSFMMSSFKVDERVLSNDALVIEVVIQIMTTSEQPSQDMPCPRNPAMKNLLQLLKSGDRADVAFKIADTTILAHKFILGVNAPALARICDGNDKTLQKPVQIFNTSPEAFRHVLTYVYGGAAPSTEIILRIGKDILAIAYRFGITQLKHEVEQIMVECCVVDTYNCVDILVFAHQSDCKLLKKHAINFLFTRPHDVLSSETARKLKSNSDLMHEIMLALAGKGVYKKTKSSQKQRRNRSPLKGFRLRKKKKKKKRSTQKPDVNTQIMSEALDWQEKADRIDLIRTNAQQQSPEEDRLCTIVSRGPDAIESEKVRQDAEKARSEAMRILQVVEKQQSSSRSKLMAEKRSLQNQSSHYKQKYGSSGWIVGR